MGKIMIIAKIPISQIEAMERIRFSKGLPSSEILAEGLKEAEFEGIDAVEEERVSIRLYVEPMEKRQLEKLSRKHKASIASIVRGVLAKSISKLDL